MRAQTSTHDADAIVLSGDLVVRALAGPDELRGACRVYRETFGYTGPDEQLNPRLLQGLRHNGGTVVGVVADGRVRAMAFGWSAWESDPADTGIYHWSQAAAVDPSLQGQGVGRALKTVQAHCAEQLGATRMRWTFDPLSSRNAHFNLDVLGTRGRWFLPDAQGTPGTDRIAVEWTFGPDAAPRGVPDAPPDVVAGEVHVDGPHAYLGIGGERDRAQQPAGGLRGLFEQLFYDGYEAISCRPSTSAGASATTSVYSFTRRHHQ